MDAAGRKVRWGKSKIRQYCHGGIHPDRKQPKDGCAAIWPVWGAVSYYLETAVLIEDGMPAPDHFTREDWRAMHRIKTAEAKIRIDEAPRREES